MEKVWGGRFREGLDPIAERFNASISFDFRLYPYDIKGTVAHCKILEKAGIIKKDEAKKIIEALGKIGEEIRSGKIKAEGYEDIHTLVEKKLIEKLGEIGEKIHTGRSRNDQVSLDMRLFVKDAIRDVISKIKKLQLSLIDLAEKNIDIIIPGYTHLQRAQPVLLSHHLMAYYEMLKRDKERFRQSFRRTDVMPLGSGAIAGTSFEFEREIALKELGFSEMSRNSIDAVSDRDFVIDFIYSASVLMLHLSRLSEEIILWSTKEFSFIDLPDSFSTGSSIMPQKKNPDIAELIRGKTARIYGNLMCMLTLMKALPLAYNKDMQEDKEPLFDTYDTVCDCLEVIARLVKGIRFNREKIKEEVKKGYITATDLAEYLVRKGIPFRKAHRIVGEIVLYAIEKGKQLDELSLDELKKFSSIIEDDVYEWLDPENSVRKKKIYGGTSPEYVKRSIEEAKKELERE